MDHAINALRPYLEVEMDCVREEWTSGEYSKISDCPSYPAAKAIVDAIHKLEKYYHGKVKTLSIRDQLRW
jgi:hypothetical protein